jgi:NAD(P)-dependent dehydrogenase (short-subunit alcohol dehydrogenase family)
VSKLDGQVAVITGGVGGIGFALAKRLGADGASIVLADTNQESLNDAVSTLAAAGTDTIGVQCDVAEQSSVEALADQAFAWKGRVDLLINNAGIGQTRAKLPDAELANAQRVMAVNFWGVWNGCAAFCPRMAAQDHPSGIYNVGSENSLFCAISRSASYIASKHAVLGLTESFREDMPDHVAVGTIMPGWVATGIMPPEIAKLAMPADEFADIIVPQILAGEPFVVSHPYNAVRNAERAETIADSYARNAPRYDGDDEYDVRAYVAKMRER